jgi:hypothetical protein
MLADDLSALTDAVIRSLNVIRDAMGGIQLDRAVPLSVQKDMAQKCIDAIIADQGSPDTGKVAAFDELYATYKEALLHILFRFRDQNRLPYENFDTFRSTHSWLPDQVITALFGENMHQALYDIEVILSDLPDGSGYY